MRELIQVSREVDSQHPEWLRYNRVSTVFKFTQEMVKQLKAEGHKVSYVGKTRGEGQFTPPGWQTVVVKGYELSGVSHDALWVDGKQYDFVGQGNDSEEEIFYGDGRHMEGRPVANEIPSQYWRANNPPVDLDGQVTFDPDPPLVPVPVVPAPPKVTPYEGDEFWTKIGEALWRDYHKRPAELDAGAAMWIGRLAYHIKSEGKTRDEAIALQRDNWLVALDQIESTPGTPKDFYKCKICNASITVEHGKPWKIVHGAH